jgi:N-sulfoglucosamine sulfohydrolase
MGIAAPLSARDGGARPNIVVILTDDQGCEIGAYGDNQAITPNLDKLASGGALFARAFVAQSSCSPSRSSLITGLYPHQSGQIGLDQFGYAMRPGIPTVFNHLKSAGYRTGWIGKTHVSPGEEVMKDVDEHALGAPATIQVRQTAERARKFIAGCGAAPFFLFYNLVDPHAPYKDQVAGEPPKPRGPADVEPWPYIGVGNAARAKQLVASYYNCVERADRGVGYLLQVLADLGKADNTLVIFTSDNGPGFPRAKSHNTWVGTRVPLIVRWPGHATGGMRMEQLVSFVDLAPTLLEAAGVPIPENLPGRSFLPLLRGEATAWRTHVFTEHTAHCPNQYFPRRAVTDGRHLLVWNLEGGKRGNPFPMGDARSEVIMDLIAKTMPGSDLAKAIERAKNPPEFELIDIQNDPAELHNLADNPEYAPILADLKERIQHWQEETNDPLRDPATLAKVSRWHDELNALEEPKDNKGRVPALQEHFVSPRYQELLKSLNARQP